MSNTNAASGDNDRNDARLYNAVARGCAEEVKKSLASGANPNCSFDDEEYLSCLDVAAKRGDLEIARLLVAAGAKADHEALYQAASFNRTEMINFLITENASVYPNSTNPNCPRSALLAAAFGGHKAIVHRLMDYEPNFPAEHLEYALCDAAFGGHASVVRLLLERGVNPDTPNDPDERTALNEASLIGDITIVDLLLSHKADPNYLSACGTALHCAISNKHNTVVARLLAAGARTDITNQNGETQLDLAIHSNAEISGMVDRASKSLVQKATNEHRHLRISTQRNRVKKIEGLAAGEEWIVFDPDLEDWKFSSDGEMRDYFQLAPLNERKAVMVWSDGRALRSEDVRCFYPASIEIIPGANEIAGEHEHRDESNRERITRSPERVALFSAVGASNINALKEQLQQGVEVNVYDGMTTPLHEAVNYSYLDIAHILLDHGADANAKDYFGAMPLHHAVMAGDAPMVRLLLRYGADVKAELHGKSPLQDAWLTKNLDVLRALLHAGADLNAELDGPLAWAIRTENTLITDLLLEYDVNVNEGDRDLFPEHPSGRGNTPLHYAVYRGNVTLVRTLLQRGADVNAAYYPFNETPLHWAMYNLTNIQLTEIVPLLLEYGADVNAKAKEGATPLHWAHGIEVISLLLKCGADINAMDLDGETPLFRAVKSDSIDDARLLLENGAGANITDFEGTPPHYIAKSEVIKNLLVEFGADPNW